MTAAQVPPGLSTEAISETSLTEDGVHFEHRRAVNDTARPMQSSAPSSARAGSGAPGTHRAAPPAAAPRSSCLRPICSRLLSRRSGRAGGEAGGSAGVAALAIVGDGRPQHAGARCPGIAAATRTRADGAGSIGAQL